MATSQQGDLQRATLHSACPGIQLRNHEIMWKHVHIRFSHTLGNRALLQQTLKIIITTTTTTIVQVLDASCYRDFGKYIFQTCFL